MDGLRQLKSQRNVACAHYRRDNAVAPLEMEFESGTLKRTVPVNVILPSDTALKCDKDNTNRTRLNGTGDEG